MISLNFHHLRKTLLQAMRIYYDDALDAFALWNLQVTAWKLLLRTQVPPALLPSTEAEHLAYAQRQETEAPAVQAIEDQEAIYLVLAMEY